MRANSISPLHVAETGKTWAAWKGGVGCMGTAHWLQFSVNIKLNEKSVWGVMFILFCDFHSPL